MIQNEINQIMSALEEELEPNVMGDDELQGIVGKEIEDAIDYSDNWYRHIAPRQPSIIAATRLAMRKRAAAKWSAWTCGIPYRPSCRR